MTQIRTPDRQQRSISAATRNHRTPVDSLAPPAVQGSMAMARTHLANERTFLAWNRTAFSLFALGLAVALFYEGSGRMSGIETAISLALSIAGILTAVLGYVRYQHVHDRIELGDRCDKVSKTIGIAATLVVASGTLVVGFILLLAAAA